MLRALRAIRNIGPLLHGCRLDLERVLLVLFVFASVLDSPIVIAHAVVSNPGEAWHPNSPRVAMSLWPALFPLYLDIASEVT